MCIVRFSALKTSMFALFFIAIASSFMPAMAQNLNGSPSTQMKLDNPALVSRPRILTPQQTQAVQSMTAAQIQQYQTIIQPTLTNLRNEIAAHQQSTTLPNWQNLIRGTATSSSGQRSVSSSTFNFSNSNGTVLTVQPRTIIGANGVASANMPMRFPGPPHPCPVLGCGGGCQPPLCTHIDPDYDHDGLPDSFEKQVADSFAPLYGSSAGEPDQFATFGNYVPMTVTSLVGTVPPFSYFRVQPLGLATDPNGTQVFALRIDYLTLWNADGGLIGGGGACYYSYVGLDGVLQQLSGHDLDAERSGMLVAAPAVNRGYNPDPNVYSLYTVYMAAHEGTFFDQSAYASFSPAVPSGNHLNLALSLSKHSTYNFNPNYLPITPQWFIASYNAAFLALWQEGVISDIQYYLSISLGNETFYGCLVERFSAQGGSYANQRINVGEPTYPINGSTFIQDDSSRALHLTDKLTNPLF